MPTTKSLRPLAGWMILAAFCATHIGLGVATVACGFDDDQPLVVWFALGQLCLSLVLWPLLLHRIISESLRS